MVRHIKKFKAFTKLSNPRYSVGVIGIALVVGVGSYFLFSSKALTPYVSLEAASGTLTSPAYTYNDPTASNGEAVGFGVLTGASGVSPLLLSMYAGSSDSPYPFTATAIPSGCVDTCTENVNNGVPDTSLWGKTQAMLTGYISGGWGGNAGTFGMLNSIDLIGKGSGTYTNYGVVDKPNPPSDIYRAVLSMGLIGGGNDCGSSCITTDNPLTDGITQGTSTNPDLNPADYVNNYTVSQADCATTSAAYPDGPYASYMEQTAQEIAKDGFKSPVIRLDWEMNGTWYGNEDAAGFLQDVPYSQDYASFKQCWVNDVNALRAGWAQYGQGDGQLMIDFDPSLGISPGGSGGYVQVETGSCGWNVPSATNCDVPAILDKGCSNNTSSQYYDPKGCTTGINDVWVPLNWATIYPGDKYVDIIGTDSYDAANPEYCSIGAAGADDHCMGDSSDGSTDIQNLSSDYNNPTWLIDNTCVSPSNPNIQDPVACNTSTKISGGQFAGMTQVQVQQANEVQNWTNMLGTAGTPGDNFFDGTGGLLQQVAFAKVHGKLMSFPEWGDSIHGSRGGGDDPYYMTQMINWMSNKNNVNGYSNYYYESYYNTDCDDKGCCQGNGQAVTLNFPGNSKVPPCSGGFDGTGGSFYNLFNGYFPNSLAAFKSGLAPYAGDRDPANPNG